MYLNTIKKTLPDIFDYKGKEYTMSHYSYEIFATKKYPTRSKIIEWRTKENDLIILEDNKIISSI